MPITMAMSTATTRDRVGNNTTARDGSRLQAAWTVCAIRKLLAVSAISDGATSIPAAGAADSAGVAGPTVAAGVVEDLVVSITEGLMDFAVAAASAVD